MATECVHIQHPPVCWDTVCNCSYLTVGCPYSHRTLLLWQLFLSSFPLAFLTLVLALGNNKVFILLLHSEVQHSFVWYRTGMSFDHREHKLRLEPMDSLKRLSSPCSPWIQTASSFHQHGLLPIAVWVPQCMVCWRKDIAEAENKAELLTSSRFTARKFPPYHVREAQSAATLWFYCGYLSSNSPRPPLLF